MDELEYLRQKALSIIEKTNKDKFYDKLKELISNDTDLTRLKRFVRNDEKWQKLNDKERVESNIGFLTAYDKKYKTNFVKEYKKAEEANKC